LVGKEKIRKRVANWGPASIIISFVLGAIHCVVDEILYKKETDMKTDRHALHYLFNDLIKLSVEYPGDRGWGIGCSSLLETMILRQKTFIDKILDDDSGDFHEYRINGAGLKMHWRVVFGKFQCYISGDQVAPYADFVVHAKELIRKYGCNHRHIAPNAKSKLH